MTTKIALIGRPNVGKSTIFNRLIRSNRAITHDQPGITRDRIEGIVHSYDLPSFIIIDTGGITIDNHHTSVSVSHKSSGFEEAIFQQAKVALKESQVFCFVVDGKDGLMPFDEHLAMFLRQKGKPILLVVNKVDGIEKEEQVTAEFHTLGFPIIAVSAEHGHNLKALRYKLTLLIQDAPETTIQKPKLKLAVLGRPNAGKSSLINTFLGNQRMIVSESSGTTRDSVDIPFTLKNTPYLFVDTAGIRRRTKITDTIEKFSVSASLKSASKANITLYLIDATEGISTQDKKIVNLLNTKKIPFFLLMNKVDLLTNKEQQVLDKTVKEIIQFCPHIPLLTISALTSKGIKKIIPIAEKIHTECSTRITTRNLNKAMEEILKSHQPPVIQRVRPKFFYLTQAEIDPPTFVFFVNDAERISENYKRYLERSLRKIFNFQYAPIRINLRSSHKKRT